MKKPLEENGIPVSYTHLDVYKRQRIDNDCNDPSF